jgi:hypothetical protein
VKIQVEVFWVMKPDSVIVGQQRFGESYCFHLQVDALWIVTPRIYGSGATFRWTVLPPSSSRRLLGCDAVQCYDKGATFRSNVHAQTPLLDTTLLRTSGLTS